MTSFKRVLCFGMFIIVSTTLRSTCLVNLRPGVAFALKFRDRRWVKSRRRASDVAQSPCLRLGTRIDADPAVDLRPGKNLLLVNCEVWMTRAEKSSLDEQTRGSRAYIVTQRLNTVAAPLHAEIAHLGRPQSSLVSTHPRGHRTAVCL